MSWFSRDKAQQALEELSMRTFYTAELAAAESYDVAMNRVEEGDVYTLFGKLRSTHLEFADDFKKRVKKLGGDPEDRTGIGELGGRAIARVNSVGSIRDLLIAMRQGEENGVAMCREALDEAPLSRKHKSLVETALRMHIDNIRDLSEQIALRGTYTGTMIESLAPQWLRYPKAGFWLLEGGLVLLGYLFGRSGGNNEHGQAQPLTGSRTSPRAELGGEQATQQGGEQIAREVGR